MHMKNQYVKQRSLKSFSLSNINYCKQITTPVQLLIQSVTQSAIHWQQNNVENDLNETKNADLNEKNVISVSFSVERLLVPDGLD